MTSTVYAALALVLAVLVILLRKPGYAAHLGITRFVLAFFAAALLVASLIELSR